MARIFKFVQVALGIAMFGSALVAISLTHVASDPKIPDPSSGHIVPFAVRGAGTVYLTQQEWDAIGPYWNTVYVLVGLLVASVIARVVYEGCGGFMKEWRSRGDR